MFKICLPVILLLFSTNIFSQDSKTKIVKEYTVPASKQAVAVDSFHFYVINNSTITKHIKSTGELIKEWTDNDSLLNHLNSGIIIDGKLFCCNSNYSESPMASSIEIFDPITLEHLDNHSFGIFNGSATWIDKYKDFWYVAFAHYTGKGSEPGKDNSWSRLIKFDSEWRQIESWIFPKELIKKFGIKSCSGGVILHDGQILCTGHDLYEIYVLKFPEKGYTLEWYKTIPVGSYGQGIAYEKQGDAELIYGIVKKENKVVVTRVNSSIAQ